MGLRDFILQAIAKLPPIIKLDVNIKSPRIGGVDYRVENGNIVFDAGGGVEEKIPLVKDRSGVWRPVIDGIPVEPLAEAKDENVKGLDVEGKIFTRADIGSPQIELLKLEPDDVIRALKPVLFNHLSGRDMGALIAASAIIIVEDKRQDGDLSLRLHTSFRSAFKSRGAMIYNLFRSGILEGEILDSLGRLTRVFKSTELPAQFLPYWDSILTKGYPTAYFVKWGDSLESFSAELDWRFQQGEKFVRVFSRTLSRNTLVIKWCAEYCEKHGLRSSKRKEYPLGFSPAVRIIIYNKKGRTATA